MEEFDFDFEIPDSEDSANIKGVLSVNLALQVSLMDFLLIIEGNYLLFLLIGMDFFFFFVLGWNLEFSFKDDRYESTLVKYW